MNFWFLDELGRLPLDFHEYGFIFSDWPDRYRGAWRHFVGSLTRASLAIVERRLLWTSGEVLPVLQALLLGHRPLNREKKSREK